MEIVHRLYRVLSEEDKRRHKSLFGSYVKEDSLHYCYRVTLDEVAARLQQIGIDPGEMLKALETAYGQEKAYRDAGGYLANTFAVKEEQSPCLSARRAIRQKCGMGELPGATVRDLTEQAVKIVR